MLFPRYELNPRSSIWEALSFDPQKRMTSRMGSWLSIGTAPMYCRVLPLLRKLPEMGCWAEAHPTQASNANARSPFLTFSMRSSILHKVASVWHGLGKQFNQPTERANELTVRPREALCPSIIALSVQEPLLQSRPSRLADDNPFRGGRTNVQQVLSIEINTEALHTAALDNHLPIRSKK